MAKEFSFDFKIGGQLASSFASAFNSAKGIIKSASAETKAINASQIAEQKRLSNEMRALGKEQSALDKAYKAGKMSAEQYAASLSTLEGKLKRVESEEQKLTASMAKQSLAAKAQENFNKAMNVAPINGVSNAVQNATGRVQGFVGKIAGLAAMGATGFGLTALVGNSVEAGEATYQLATKLHLTAAEAGQFSKIMSFTGGDVDLAAKTIMKLDKSISSSGKAGENARAKLTEWGVSLTDANGKLLPVNDQMKRLAEGYKKASEAGREQEFVMNTLGPKGMELAKTLKGYDEAAEMAAKVKTVGLDPMQMHQLALNMKLLKAEGAQLQLAFTSAFAPLVAELLPLIIPQMQNLATWLAKNKQEIATFASGAIKFAALYESSKLLVSGFMSAKKAFDEFKAGANAFKAASALVGGPWIIAIMAIITAIYLIYTHWDTISQFVTSTWTAVCAKVSSAWSTIVGGIRGVISGIGAFLAGAFNLWIGFIKAYINFWLNLPTNIAYVVGFIVGIIPRIPEVVSSMVSQVGAFLSNLVSKCISVGAEFIASTIAWVRGTWNAAVSGVSNMVSDVIAFLENLPSACASAGTRFIAAAGEWGIGAYNAVMDWISKLPDAIMNAVSNAWANAKASLSSAFNSGVSTGSGDRANAAGGIYGQGEFTTSFAENSAEAAIPIDGSPRSKGLWKRTGELLGMGNSGGGMQVSLTVPVTVNGNSDGQTQNIQQAVQEAVERALQRIQIQKERTSYA